MFFYYILMHQAIIFNEPDKIRIIIKNTFYKKLYHFRSLYMLISFSILKLSEISKSLIIINISHFNAGTGTNVNSLTKNRKLCIT